MGEKSTAWLILVSLMSVVVAGYLLAWRGKRSAVRKAASGLVAAVSGLAGIVGIAGYAIPALSDFRSSVDSFASAVIANVIIWGICLAAVVIAVRFAASALQKQLDD
jgi:hypothetical protein